MLRAIVIIMAASTAALVVAAVFFSGPTESEKVDERAFGLYRAGKYEDATAVWRDGVAKFPQSAALHCGLGTMLAARKDFVPATEHLETSVRLAPKEPRFRKELALCYLQQGRDADAERELKTVLAEADWLPEAHYFLGHIYERRGERGRALDEYVRELNVNPCSTFAQAKILTWKDAGAP